MLLSSSAKKKNYLVSRIGFLNSYLFNYLSFMEIFYWPLPHYHNKLDSPSFQMSPPAWQFQILNSISCQHILQFFRSLCQITVSANIFNFSSPVLFFAKAVFPCLSVLPYWDYLISCFAILL